MSGHTIVSLEFAVSAFLCGVTTGVVIAALIFQRRFPDVPIFQKKSAVRPRD